MVVGPGSIVNVIPSVVMAETPVAAGSVNVSVPIPIPLGPMTIVWPSSVNVEVPDPISKVDPPNTTSVPVVTPGKVEAEAEGDTETDPDAGSGSRVRVIPSVVRVVGPVTVGN
jgi:hypothetical protein